MHDGRVVLADFGCADAASAGFVAAGTTQFQPPECRRQRSGGGGAGGAGGAAGEEGGGGGGGRQMAVLPKGYDQRAQDM